MQNLVQEYKQSLKWVEEAKDTASDEDKVYLGSMASDLRYALEWMQTGRRLVIEEELREEQHIKSNSHLIH
ncbi:hypothetical protein JCM9140_3124 [Halalkalibacter wakoensis JCM 9140]|uniref:Uncharacterized protein n=1 Tax=Halalkalibacter wakoensis JCM 9140 TaxID=1236970 RepID=W4Q5P5_9BACI|nr:hypothetical protein JCM9140_3124 [Halalkalibacter wakoensis JCM 9140]